MLEVSRHFKTALLFSASLSIALLGTSCGKNSVPGLKKFQAGVQDKRLFVSFLSLRLHWDYGGSVAIPGVNGSLVSVSSDVATGGTKFEFSIDTASLFDDISNNFEAKGLPDGRPIPDIQGGILPRWEVPIHDDFKLSVYLSKDAFGIFVPISLSSKKGFPLLMTISMEIHDERGNLIGKAYAIPADGGQSGLLALIPFTI